MMSRIASEALKLGTAGSSPVPTLELPPQTAIVNADPAASVRATPNGERLAQTLPPGTAVLVSQPQPGGGDDGWLHVTAQVGGEELSGWISNGFDEIELVQQAEPLADRRVRARLETLGYLLPDAITDFQQMNGLEVTGVLDDPTLAAMWSANAV